MSKKKEIKKDLEVMKKLVEEESLECYTEYDAEYHFDCFSKDVATLYVRQHSDSVNPVEFHMLKRLQEFVTAVNPRYKVGIIFEDRDDMEDDDE
jgi:hypothetical protein